MTEPVPDICPGCGLELLGDPIPEQHAHLYGGTHFRREIGVEIRGVYDGVLFWACPDCGHAWNRWSKDTYRHKLAEHHMDRFKWSNAQRQ